MTTVFTDAGRKALKALEARDELSLRTDPAFDLINPIGTDLTYTIWKDKYRWGDETYEGMAQRVAQAVYAKEADGLPGQERLNEIRAYCAMRRQLWMPAGRILAGAGTPKRVTLLNCFVNSKLEDDMESIAKGIGNIMLTMQQGGGVGTDFSPLRPPMAVLRRTGSVASGPGPFLSTWDSVCDTIKSAGDRRGAMMGTLGCWHPFLPEFIQAKHTKGVWTNFNVSILITDAFMGAVEDDEEWYLHHSVPPAYERPQELVDLDFEDDYYEGKQYVYSVHRARDLWDDIIRSTYVYAEPGVIFIDQINDRNNLGYCEDIQCTNPCGEQPLPPHGCCDLGAVVVSRCVKDPFTEDAHFDWALLREVVAIGTRFLDNVIDVTNYPLPEQREEEFAKRRIGVGISGLADALHMMGLRYGSPRSVELTEKIMQEVCYAAYRTSIELAKEKGSFPLFNSEELLKRPFIQQLPQDIQQGIRDGYLRNGVLLTIAPTGTTSIAYGNGSSGLEPVFAHSMSRNVTQPDGSFKPYDEVAYGARLWLALNPGKELTDLPTYMNVCADVKVHEHIRIQEVCQRWVDASISKTINVPEDIPYEDFKYVYKLAYESGCKGCTTYRPSDIRGSILSTGKSSDLSRDAESGRAESRPGDAALGRHEFLAGTTAKVRWPGMSSALFLTVNWMEGKPYEVFMNSKDQKSLEWQMALTILMSKCLRAGISLDEIAKEFLQVQALEGGWAENGEGKQKYWPSLIAYLGYKLQLIQDPFTTVHQDVPSSEPLEAGTVAHIDPNKSSLRMERCPSCNQKSATSLTGCLTCTECGWSKCG